NMLDTAERFLQKNSNRLNEDEIAGTRKLMEELRDIQEGDDKDLIHSRIEALNDFTRPFAERIMDHAISEAMKGKML
ncbi:MAG: heat-shock protein Hsp70, partial [Chitinophagales bacterium]|nr:heat-shock protein Hsp70 [Chitinophagales bacterium]